VRQQSPEVCAAAAAGHIILTPNAELAAALIDIVLGVLVYGSTVLAIDASRIQAFLALITPRFRKAPKMA